MVSWSDLKEAEVKEPPFLCYPIVPEGGIVLLHGKWSTGKSPLGWHLAAAIGEGKDFFGLQTRKARVLYIEVDTPMLLVKDRTDKLPPAKNVWFVFMPQFNAVLPSPAELEFFGGIREHIAPEFVVINTLRKVHQLDDVKSTTPSMVYGAFQKLFPGAALMFVHHDKKDNPDPKARYKGDEAFSGSQHWADDAQICLHLVKHGKGVLRLDHTKSQVSKLVPPIMLELDDDGSHLRPYGDSKKQKTQEWLALPEVASLTAREQDRQLAELLRLSERSARTYRLDNQSPSKAHPDS